MASVRNLKKDVDAVIFELVSDCYTYKYLFPDKETQKVESLIQKSLELRNGLFKRINNPESDDKKELKKHFKSIYDELFKGADEAFTELSKLAK